ncbi:hypothetical protein [Lactobacillus sp.]|uniref:hypothetical protein n=1 Tax=Lactobacillus sp. TaxID=1591 RepID=UPI0025BD1DC5|nr:hypothetical protein [Lactobacillus sp.]
MAQRRMFSKLVVDTDNFMDLPASAKVLYFYLNIYADDDGFVSNPKTIKRMINASDDDLKILIAKQYLLAFEDGAMVIRHWRIHNYIRKDRYNGTAFQEDKSQLLTGENGEYLLAKDVTPEKISHETSVKVAKKQRVTDGIPVVSKRLPQVRSGQVRSGQVRESLSSEREERDFINPVVKENLDLIIDTFSKANKSLSKTDKSKLVKTLDKLDLVENSDINLKIQKVTQIALKRGDYPFAYLLKCLQDLDSINLETNKMQPQQITKSIDWNNYHPKSESDEPDLSKEKIAEIFRKYGASK